jgi:hypothetical protein
MLPQYSLTYRQKGLFLLCLLVVVLIAVSAILQRVFGTWYLPTIIKQYKERNLLGQKYDRLFKQREQLMYHISWAKSRGDFDDANKLCKDLVKLDEVVRS